jgi:polyisoprenoid-binding protein YceI
VRAVPILAILAAMIVVGPLEAASRRIPLSPPDSEVAFRAYGMGLLPIDASFTSFDGTLIYDPDNRATCQVELRVQVASLITEDVSLRGTIVGPDFMDTARFPTLAYTGSCEANEVRGALTMHGVTRPFDLSLSWKEGTVVAQGRLVRAEWGMTSRPLLGGRTVRIRVSVALADRQKQVSHPAAMP